MPWNMYYYLGDTHTLIWGFIMFSVRRSGKQFSSIITLFSSQFMYPCNLPYRSNNNNNRKKYEIATDEVGNPIKQDEKKGKLREFKKGDIFFNYGCLPVSFIILLFLQYMLCLICS